MSCHHKPHRQIFSSSSRPIPSGYSCLHPHYYRSNCTRLISFPLPRRHSRCSFLKQNATQSNIKAFVSRIFEPIGRILKRSELLFPNDIDNFSISNLRISIQDAVRMYFTVHADCVIHRQCCLIQIASQTATL